MRAGRGTLLLIYLVCVVVTTWLAAARFHAGCSAWALDLAHVVQAFHDGIHQVPQLTVRPLNHYAREGPEPWRSVHLDPIRLLLLPSYWICPRVEALLLGHAALFWLSIFPLAALARRETFHKKHTVELSLMAVILWVTTPGAWGLALNDVRTLHLGMPFVLCAILGYRQAHPLTFILGALGALLSRQEYGAAIAALVLLLPGDGKLSRHQVFLWRVATVTLGVGWMLLYLVYIGNFFGYASVWKFLHIVGDSEGHQPALTLRRAAKIAGTLFLLGGAWAWLTLRSPRYFLAALPFVLVIARRNEGSIWPGDTHGHFVRYLALPLVFWLAGGISSLASQSIRWRNVFWAGLLVWNLIIGSSMFLNIFRVPHWLPAEDRAALYTAAHAGEDVVVWTDYPYIAQFANRPAVYFAPNPQELLTTVPASARDMLVVLTIGQDRTYPLNGRALERNGFITMYRSPRIWLLRKELRRQGAKP